jgi:hypothetical protein
MKLCFLRCNFCFCFAVVEVDSLFFAPSDTFGYYFHSFCDLTRFSLEDWEDFALYGFAVSTFAVCSFMVFPFEQILIDENLNSHFFSFF